MKSDLSKVNLAGIAAGILALVSIFLPWWGITVSGFGGVGSATSFMYGFFGLPNATGPPVTSGFTSTMTIYTPIILALALLTTALTLLGSFAKNLRPLVAGLILGVATLAGYSSLVSYALTQNCQANGCIHGGPIGYADFFNVFVNWGFQSGYYLFLGATVLTIIALVNNQIQRAPSK